MLEKKIFKSSYLFSVNTSQFRYDYNTCQVNKDNFFLLCTRTNLIKKTVLYRGPVAWNMVPINIRKSNCAYIFRRKCEDMFINM